MAIVRAPDTVMQLVMDAKQHHKAMVQAGRDLNKFEREAKLAAKAQAGLDKSTSKTASSMAMASGAYVKMAAGILGVAAAAKTLDAVLGRGLKATGVFQAMPFSIDKTRKALAGLVSDLDIATAASKQASLGLGLTAEQFADLAKNAAIAGQKMGIDATQSLNDIITGIGRASPLILDNLGIIVKAKDAYAQWSKANGVLAKDMTDAQKKMAYQAAALKAVNRLSKGAKLNVDGLGASYRKLKTDVSNTIDAWSTWISELGASNKLTIESAKNIDQLALAYEKAIRQLRNTGPLGGVGGLIAGEAAKQLQVEADRVRASQALRNSLLLGNSERLKELALIKAKQKALKDMSKANADALRDANILSGRSQGRGRKAAPSTRPKVTSPLAGGLGQLSDVSDADIDRELGIGGIAPRPVVDQTENIRAEAAALDKKTTASQAAAAANAELNQSYVDLAMGGLTQFATGLWSAIDAAASGQASFGAAMAAMTKGVLMSLAQQSTVMALAETAKAFGRLAMGDIPGAGLHFKSAGIHGLVALTAGSIGVGMTAGGSTGRGASASAGGARTASNSMPHTDSQSSSGSKPAPVIINIRYDRSDPHSMRMATAKVRAEVMGAGNAQTVI